MVYGGGVRTFCGRGAGEEAVGGSGSAGFSNDLQVTLTLCVGDPGVEAVIGVLNVA